MNTHTQFINRYPLPTRKPPRREAQQNAASRTPYFKRLTLVAGLSLFGGIASPEAKAATFTWNEAGAGANNWSVTTKWAGGTAPTSNVATDLIFGGTTSYTASNNIGTGAFSFNSITFNNSSAGGVILAAPAAQTLSIPAAATAPAITQSGTGNATINLPVAFVNTLTVPPTISITNTGSLTLASLSNGNSNNPTFTGTGTGDLNITAFTTGTGTQTFTLNGAYNTTIGSFTKGNGNKVWTNNLPSGKQLTIGAYTNNGTNANNDLTFNGTGLTVITGVVSDSTSPVLLIKSGTGTLVLQGANAYAGLTTVSAGVLNIRNDLALGTSTAGTTVASGASLQLQNNINIVAESLSLAGTGVSASGALRNISGTNTYSGLITLTAAARINSDAGSLAITNAGTITGSFGLTVGGAGDTSIASVIGTNTGGLTKDGAGILTLTGANSYSGATVINNGIVNVSSLADIGSASNIGSGNTTSSATNTASLVFNGGTLQYTGPTIAINRGFTINAGNGTINTGANSVTFGGDTAGVGALTKIGSGTLVLAGTGNYTGGTTISAGTLQIGNGGTTGSISGNIVNNGTLVYQRSDSVLFAGNITGVGVFTQSGTGSITLTGTNKFSTVNALAGTLLVQPSAIGGTPAVTVASGATFGITNPTATTTVPVTTLTLGADSLSTNGLTINLNGTPGGAPLAVGSNGGLVSNGTTTLNVGNGSIPLSIGLIPLISYVGAAGGTSGGNPNHGFVLGTLPSRALGNLVTSNPGLIQLNITSIDTIKWTGADGTNPSYWDINTTTNWALASNASATNYLETASPGDTVTFDGSAAGPKTVDLRTTVSPAAITVNTSGGNYEFTGAGGIAGPGALTKQGSGTLTLTNTGANTFSAGATISQGILHVGNGTDSSSLSGNVSLAATTSLELNPGATGITIIGNITGSGAVQALTNTTILSGTGNTYSGGTTIASGATLQIGDGTSSGSLPATGLVNNGTLVFNPGIPNIQFDGNITGGAISILGSHTTVLTGTGNTFTGGTTIAAGATLQIGDGTTSSGSLAGNINSSGTLNFRTFGSATYSGDITGTGGNVGGLTGSTLLNGALSYTGVTTVGSGATLQLGDGTKAVGITGNISNAGTLSLNVATAPTIYPGVASGAGGINLLAGDLTFSGANTYSGPTNITSGATLHLPGSNRLSASTLVTVANGATLDLADNSNRVGGLVGAGSVTLGNTAGTTLTLNAAINSTFDGIISGVGNLSRLSGGTTTLTNVQTYTGTTNIQNDNSQLRIAVDNTLPVGTTLTFTGTTNLNVIFDLNGKNQTIAALTGATNGAGTAFIQNNSGSGTSILTITNGSGSFGNAPTRARLRDNDGVALGGKLGLTITGGTTIFKDSHTYTGPTTISGGTYQLGLANAVSATSAFSITGTGILDLQSFNAGLDNLTGDGTITGSTGILSVTTGSFSGLLTGGIGLTKANSGTTTLTLSNTANTFTGTLQVNNGTLEVANLTDSGPGSNGTGEIKLVNGTNPATLKYTGPATTVSRTINLFGNGNGGNGTINASGSGALQLSGTVTALGTGTAKTLTLAGTSTDLNTISGVISNGTTAVVSLVKNEAGTWKLTGTNTYTGTTTVSAGKLVIDGDNSGATGAVTVTAGATLSGSGTVGGLVTVSSGASVAPGNSPGNQTFAGGLNLSGGGTYQWELGTLSESNPGVDYDTIAVSGGSLTLGGTSNLSIDTSALVGTDPNSGDIFWTTPHTWTIATNGSIVDNFASITNGTWSSGIFDTSVSGNNVQLTFTPQAIPEPGVILFGAFSLLGFAGWHLRNRRKRLQLA